MPISSGKVDHSTQELSIHDDDDEDVWYFGFGPIVHPQVRQRRGIFTTEQRPAVLRDHRLTFALGGIATIVPRIGFMVHGVLMKLKDRATWKKLKDFDSGYYEAEELGVYPYTARDCEGEGWLLDEFFDSTTPINCYVFVTTEFEELVIERNVVEKKPQERYLRLIATGMTQYGVDDDYVQDEIMSCPFVPSRKEHEWFSFPLAKESPPSISFGAYQKLCKRQFDELYFVIGDKVMKADSCPDNNAVVTWMKSHGHGKGDLTHLLHKMHVDPDLEWAPTEKELTDRHVRWAMDLTVDYWKKADVSAQVVYTLKPEGENSQRRSTRGSIRLSWRN
mmetsp:Transcript_27770/g.76439  ORF Transcript_27770/g.76439 Transcript_27770/m.76439 type:complete len:334 (-) Transcript_27770:534-1535(-)